MVRLLAAALIAFAAPQLASAQSRAGGGASVASHAGVLGARPAAGSHSTAHGTSATRAMQRGSQSAVHPQITARGVHHGNRRFDGAPRSPSATPDFQVPGLGFDFPHLAAVSGHGHRGPRFGAFPFGFNGFLLGSPPLIVEEMPSTEAQAAPDEGKMDQIESETDRTLAGRRPVSPRAYDPQNSGSRTPEAHAEDPAEYVFVRRDGGLVFAVAYSWENGTLRYVTHDGMRRTIAREAIDLTATQQFNEQRGLSFRLPA